jgi:hypothetical protein
MRPKEILNDQERIDTRQGTRNNHRFHRGIAFGSPIGTKTTSKFAMNNRRAQMYYTR